MINVSFSPSKSKRIMSHCLAIFHKQSGDWVSLEPTLKPLSRASGSKVGLITGSGVQPLISLMPNIGFRRTPIRRAYDALRCFDDGKNSAFYAFKSKPKSICLGYYASQPRRPQRPSRAKGQVECGSSSHFGSVATLQVTVIGWPDAPPGLFGLRFIQMASIPGGGHPHGSGMVFARDVRAGERQMGCNFYRAVDSTGATTSN
jgi:hypothetical protein